MPPMLRSSPLPPTTPSRTTWIARPNARAMAKTTLEWPREKKKPTLTGFCRCWSSLRVVLSIAEMWSASNAWRRPKV